MEIEPQSRLTRERPDLWTRALTLATSTTGITYVPKRPNPDGTLSACGGPTVPLTPQQEIGILERSIKYHREINKPDWEQTRQDHPLREEMLRRVNERIQQDEERLKKLKEQLGLSTIGPYGPPALTIPVPEGAMEWLLHEVGHWIVASPEERQLPNYGYDSPLLAIPHHGKRREWEAWAFESIILAPFGEARSLCPPPHRGGVAFSKTGPIPDAHLRHAERQIETARLDIHRYRALYSEWLKWNPRGWDRLD